VEEIESTAWIEKSPRTRGQCKNAICKIVKVSYCSFEDIQRYTQEPNIKDCWTSRKTRLVQKGPTVNNTVVNLVCELSTVHT